MSKKILSGFFIILLLSLIVNSLGVQDASAGVLDSKTSYVGHYGTTDVYIIRKSTHEITTHDAHIIYTKVKYNREDGTTDYADWSFTDDGNTCVYSIDGRKSEDVSTNHFAEDVLRKCISVLNGR